MGPYTAHALERFYREDPEVEVMAVHQLTPDLAEDIARCDFVLFLDADIGGKPGVVRRSTVSGVHEPHAFSHHLTPSSLLSAAESLYGDAPSAVSLTIGVASFELGEQLSPIVAGQVKTLIDQAGKIIDTHRRAPDGRGFYEQDSHRRKAVSHLSKVGR